MAVIVPQNGTTNNCKKLTCYNCYSPRFSLGTAAGTELTVQLFINQNEIGHVM